MRFVSWLYPRIIDQTLFFKKSMYPHNSINVPRKMAAACGGRQVNRRIHPIEMNHEISILLVNLCCLWRILSAEEFWQTLLLKITDWVFKSFGIKPTQSGTRNIDGVFLASKGFDWLSQLYDRWGRNFLFWTERLDLRNDFLFGRRLFS